MHQAHAGLVLPGYLAVGTFPVYRPFILNLHLIRLVEAVSDIGDHAQQGLVSNKKA